MAKKKTNLNQVGLAGTLFNSINPYETATTKADEVAVAKTLPLNTILPDPGQPRRLLPADLIQQLSNGTLSPVDVMQTWLQKADEAADQTAHQKNLAELIKLAHSIEQHGLINPITVRQAKPEEALPTGFKYLVVTGERRYWAHVYLAYTNKKIQEGKATNDPYHIKALLSAEGISIRAHQLIENIIREDINAVERAQGVWALRYELSGVNHGSPDFDPSQEVNHGSPLVTWESVQEKLGISKRYRIFVTSVLNLSPEAQEIVLTHNMRERMIRPITQKLKNNPALQVKALQQVVLWQAENQAEDGPTRPIVSSVEMLVDHLLTEQSRKEKEMDVSARQLGPPFHLTDPKKFQRKIRRTLRYFDQLQEADLIFLTQVIASQERYHSTVDDLTNLRERINAILGAVTDRKEDKSS